MKQAVVFIHGIGEQRPMDTARRFVEAVLPEPKFGEKYWSQPDPLSEILELRRLSKVGRPKTHFYEYYWAYHVHGTKVGHLAKWLASLITRRKRDVPVHLRSLWRLSRVLVFTILVFVALGGSDYWIPLGPGTPWWFVPAAFLALVQYFSISYLGDAARYLSPTPENISIRKKIRSEGLKLLRELHDKRQYDRIIIVGHSLGTVIGYDLISRLWQEYHSVHENPRRMKQPFIKSISDIGEKLTGDDKKETDLKTDKASKDDFDEVFHEFRDT